MILDKTQAELIIEEARIDSPLMQCILKSIEIKNMIDLAYERKSDYQNCVDRRVIIMHWYVKRVDLMERIIRLSHSYKLKMEELSLLSRKEK